MSFLRAIPRQPSWSGRHDRRRGERNSRQPIASSRDGAISPETYLGGTALDDHESALANGTGLHGDGGGRAGIGGLEFLDVGVVRHGWMLRLLGRVPCAAVKGLWCRARAGFAVRTPANRISASPYHRYHRYHRYQLVIWSGFLVSLPSGKKSARAPVASAVQDRASGVSPDATGPGDRTGGCGPPLGRAFVPLGSLASMRRALDRVARSELRGALFRALRARLVCRERERALRRPTASRRRGQTV